MAIKLAIAYCFLACIYQAIAFGNALYDGSIILSIFFLILEGFCFYNAIKIFQIYDKEN